jgi:hypothetical protein
MYNDLSTQTTKNIRLKFRNKYLINNIKMKSKILDNLETKIKDNKEIKETSKTSYLSRVKTLRNAEHFPFKSQEELLDLIEELNPNDNLNSELNIIAHFFIFMEMYDKFKNLFTEEMIKDLNVQQDILSSAKKEKVNEKRDNDMSFEKLRSFKSKANDLKRDEKLLYLLYVNPGIGFVPRNDFTNMEIVDSIDDATDKDTNYYTKDKNQFILNEYKTSKKYGKIIVDVPEEAIPLVEKNKNYVFENSEGESMSENTLQHKISRFMHKLTGEKITINTIRRAFANHIADLPDAERVKLAHKMGHSGHTNKKMYSYDDKE